MENLRQALLSLAERFRDDLLEFYRENIISIVLYGSVARGDCHEGSDINLLAVFKELPERRKERYKSIEMALKSVNRDLISLFKKEGILTNINVLIKSMEEMEGYSSLFLDMTQDGVILYDRDWFITNKLGKLRKTLEEGNSRRTWVGRLWFWQTPYVVQFAPPSLRQAEYHLHQGEIALKDKYWNICVRESAESLFLAIRAILRANSIEISGKFLSSHFLKIILDELPENARKSLEEASLIFPNLYNDWNFSFYYDEGANEKKYSFKEEDARIALQDAERVYNLAREIVIKSLREKASFNY